MKSRKRLLFFGTPDFSVKTLESLIQCPDFEVVAVVTQPDRPAGRGNKLAPSPVKQLANQHKIPVLQPEKIKAELDQFLAALKKFEPIDLNVVIAFGQILPLKILNFPRCGSINIHASLLPRWRGAAPIQRAIMSADSESGVCLMHMEKGLDTGAVYSSLQTKITEQDDFGALHDRLALLGAQLCVRDLGKIILGELKAIPQDTQGVTYAHKIENNEAQISWNKNAREISAHIRALSPIPGAFTYVQGKRLKIYNVRSTSNWPGTANAAVGTVTRVERAVLEVKCLDGALALESVQLEGKKRMEIEEFLRGNLVKVGSTLGALSPIAPSSISS